jgi:ferredoxin
MSAPTLPIGSQVNIEPPQLQVLIDELRSRRYRTIGPQVRDGAVVYGDLNTIDQLPLGYVDQQDGGSYRLERRNGAGYFDFSVGPDSLKRYFFPPSESLLEGHKTDDQWQFYCPPVEPPRLAVIGARACDLRALDVQDRVFLRGPYVDPAYRSRREGLFVVAINCRRAAPTCFCHAFGIGPNVKAGFDLALNELDGQFMVTVGSERGAEIMSTLVWTRCTLRELDELRLAADALEAAMAERIKTADRTPQNGEPRQRTLDASIVHDLLLDNLEHPRWAAVAERCLSCGNCTMVCPTCFCASVEEVSDLSGDQVRRERRWDSCFTAEHSYMNSGSVRKATRSRYRQWLTHKLATWIDQFGVSGCVGCGRCITWCPVGIDLTEEVAAIQGTQP